MDLPVAVHLGVKAYETSQQGRAGARMTEDKVLIHREEGFQLLNFGLTERRDRGVPRRRFRSFRE
jgi:hypothetical protein